MLECDVCGAGWFSSTPGMACPWCAERPELDRQIQASIDTCRLRDYLDAIADGSQDAIVAASRLLGVAIPRGTMPAGAMKQLIQAIQQAEAEAA